MEWLLNKPYVNEVTLTGQNPPLKKMLASWSFYTVFETCLSFMLKNLGSVGQRAAKLPSIKLWE